MHRSVSARNEGSLSNKHAHVGTISLPLYKLFGSITNGHVADALGKDGVSLDKKFIQIVGGSVKALGHYTANVRLHREVVVAFEFDVVAEA